MIGKTISAYIDVETAQRIEAIAVLEQRKKAQVAGMALKFFAALPDEARAAWIQLSSGSPSQYDLVHQQVLAEMQVEGLGNLATEDDILDVAVSLTQQ
jgi:hypothetical protein